MIPCMEKALTSWPSAFAILGVLWAGYLYYYSPDWLSIMLGVGTGCLLAGFAISVTGNKTPDFMVAMLTV